MSDVLERKRLGRELNGRLIVSAPNLAGIACRVCGRAGGLVYQKVRKFSPPLVVIGWLLLVPSFLGVSCGGMTLLATAGAAAGSAQDLEREYADSLSTIEGLSDQQVQTIAAKGVRPDRPQLTALGLNSSQADAVIRAHGLRSAGQAGAAVGTGLVGSFGIFVVATSFIGGVFGWLLLLKKKVISCRSCSGIHSEAV